MAGSYRTFFKKDISRDFFMKEHFEVWPFCSSRFNDNNDNLISRLQITVADAINKKVKLPDFMIFVLDNDLIEFLAFKKAGVSVLLGTWLEWLFNQVHEMVLTRKDALRAKC